MSEGNREDTREAVEAVHRAVPGMLLTGYGMAVFMYTCISHVFSDISESVMRRCGYILTLF